MRSTSTNLEDGGERVSYFHAGGIDRPLLISKSGVQIVPHQNWRGVFSAGTYGSGSLVGKKSDCMVFPPQNCTPVDWPGVHTTAWHQRTTGEIRNWFGSLATGMRDASGQTYMRNRYYDPATGQFTQPDPIGLAGGLNSYGFAAGDPVSFSDPYGLAPEECPPCDDIKRKVKERKINPLKLAVGVTNVGIGAAKMGTGAAQMLGASTTGAIFFISVPLSVAGTYNLASGFGAVNRGARQAMESVNDSDGPSWKNVLGLGPAGQMYDDPGEPGPIEYGKGLLRQFVSDPFGAAKRAITDWLGL